MKVQLSEFVYEKILLLQSFHCSQSKGKVFRDNVVVIVEYSYKSTTQGGTAYLRAGPVDTAGILKLTLSAVDVFTVVVREKTAQFAVQQISTFPQLQHARFHASIFVGIHS